MAYRINTFAEFLHEIGKRFDVVNNIHRVRGEDHRLIGNPEIDLSEAAHSATSS